MIRDVGDAVILSTQVRNTAGALTDATVVLLVTKPDGSTTSPAVSHDGTGLYSASLTVDQAGLWQYKWTASGAVVSVEADQFTVVTPQRALVASTEEFKSHLNRTDITDDAELRTYLVSATDYVEYHIGGPVSVQTFTEQARASANLITPLKRPLVSVISLTPDLSSALDSSLYVVDTGRGVIRFRYGYACGWYTLVYRAGLSVIAERHKLAGLIIAQHLWMVQNGGGGMPFPGDTETPTYWQGFAIPNRAKELLAPDAMPRFA